MVKWTKADLKRIESLISLAATFGIDAITGQRLRNELPLQCFMYGIGELHGIDLEYIDRAEKMIEWLDSPIGQRVYPYPVARQEIADRQRAMIKEHRARIRILQRLKEKVEQFGLPDEYLKKDQKTT